MGVEFPKFFTEEEFTFSEVAARKGILNHPGPEERAALCALAWNVLVPIREHFGPYRITSGYRCDEVNRLVGSSGRSQHIKGEAADGYPLTGVRKNKMILVMAWLARSQVPFDQCIYEFGSWLHVSHAYDSIQRRELLVAEKVKDAAGHRRTRYRKVASIEEI